MDKKNFSTSYVPLQRPYQIIKYGKDIGMQIGTLVASCLLDGDEGHPFRIESHSYPVVTCYDTKTSKLDREVYGIQPMEGVVWNRVELRDVMTICLTGDHLTWQDFINLLWADIHRTGFVAEPEYDLARALRGLDVTIDPSPKGKHTVHLELSENLITNERRVSSSKKDIIALNIAWDEDLQKMKLQMMYQMVFYSLSNIGMSISSGKRPPYTFVFESKNEELAPLVSLLNGLKNEDWDLVAIFKSKFYSLPFDDRLNIVDGIVDKVRKGEV